jgi:hypothetical protein
MKSSRREVELVNQQYWSLIRRLPGRTVAAIAVVVLSGAVGTYFLFSSKAATPTASIEAESGNITTAASIADTTASGSRAVKFQAGGSGSNACPPYPSFPTGSCTGVPAGTTLTVKSGNQTVSTAGAVINGWDVRGKLIINANSVTVKNSIVHGPAASGCSNGAAIEINNGGAVIQDVEVVMDNPTACLDGIWTFGNNAILTRVHVHGGVDGIKTGSNVLIQDSYIHNMKWFASDPNQGGGETHNDGVQTFAGDSNVTLQHNRIDMSTVLDSGGQLASNAAWQDSALNSRVEYNYLDGGGCTVNIAAQSLGGGATLTPIYVNNNHFGRNRGFSGCVVLISNSCVMTEYNSNVWDDTGQPVPTYQQHN